MSMTNSDKHNNLLLRMRNNKIRRIKLKTQKRNITQTSKEKNWWSLDQSFAGCLRNIIKLLSTHFLSNNFSKNIKY